jgi:UDP-N-acetylglucosamine 2-epimerase (non-hydrolysing)
MSAAAGSVAQSGPRPVLCVVGARPNFVKMAPLLRAFAARRPALPDYLVHTGQHYDHEMSGSMFAALGLRAPDVNLEVGSGSHAAQTAEVMRRFAGVLEKVRPACVLVVGDCNSALACALVAVKEKVPVVHVEAGLRSGDRGMPEEINRLLVDQIAELLFTTERGADANLAREGIDARRIHFVGNVMIDALRANLEQAPPARRTLLEAGVGPALAGHATGYALLTLHRPSNVDQAETLRPLLEVLREVADRLPLVFALHPRTRASIGRLRLGALLEHPSIALLPPQGYLEMLGLMDAATVVLTDSGGIQEETTAIGKPCVTLRENTERPVTIEQGTNVLAGRDRGLILGAVDEVLAGGGKRGRQPEFWDGRAAERIAGIMAQWLSAMPRESAHAAAAA